MRPRSTFLAGFCLAVAGFAPVVAAQGFERALPDGTVAFVGIDDLAKMREGFSTSKFGDLWRDDACAPMREAATGWFDLMSEMTVREAGYDPFALLDAVKGPLGLAVLELTEPRKTGERSVTMGGAFCVLADVGDGGEAVIAQIDRALEKAAATGKFTRSADTAGDVEVTVLDLGDAQDEDRMQVRFGLAGNVFVSVIASASVADRDHFGSIVEGLNTAPDDALVDGDAFSRSLAADERVGMRAFVDTPSLVSRVRALIALEGQDAEQQKVLDGLGLDGLGVISMFSENIVSAGESQARLDWSGQGAIVSCLTALLPAGEPGLFELVPETAVDAYDVHFDLKAGFERITSTMKDLGAITDEDLNLNLSMVEQDIGLSIRDDLLANLGHEVAWFTAPVEDEMQGLPGTEDAPSNFAVIVRLADGKKLATLVDDLLTKSGMAAGRKRTDFQGVNIDSLPIPGVGAANFAFTDELLVFSLSSELLQAVLRRSAGSSELPNLLGNDAVAELIDAMPKSASMFTVTEEAARIKSVAAVLRASIGAMPAMMRDDPENADADTKRMMELMRKFEIPSDDVIEKHISGYGVNAVVVGPDGIRFQAKQ
ncbi:MAG: hypothetical protein IPH13_12305 [Planctomycetes bacterium]|nr:hypothetical protein [Planctomycetota bacterium]